MHVGKVNYGSPIVNLSDVHNFIRIFFPYLLVVNEFLRVKANDTATTLLFQSKRLQHIERCDKP